MTLGVLRGMGFDDNASMRPRGLPADDAISITDDQEADEGFNEAAGTTRG